METSLEKKSKLIPFDSFIFWYHL